MPDDPVITQIRKARRSALLFAVLLPSLVLPSCTSSRWVEIQLRDAQTHFPPAAGHYDQSETYLKWPPDPGFPWIQTDHSSGDFTDGHFQLYVQTGTDIHITVSAPDVHSAFVFSADEHADSGTAAKDWSPATPATQPSHALEYQVVYPPNR